MSYKLALARYRDGDIAGSIAALNDTLRLDERLADAHYLLGVCLRDQDRVPDAIAAIGKAIALSPGLVPAREELADFYRLLNRHGTSSINSS
jgi:tetratricopeptide (TPR) repeat protein